MSDELTRLVHESRALCSPRRHDRPEQQRRRSDRVGDDAEVPSSLMTFPVLMGELAVSAISAQRAAKQWPQTHPHRVALRRLFTRRQDLWVIRTERNFELQPRPSRVISTTSSPGPRQNS